MVNYLFTLGFIINSWSSVLFPENSYLAFNIPYISPKTARVYFGVLHSPMPKSILSGGKEDQLLRE